MRRPFLFCFVDAWGFSRLNTFEVVLVQVYFALERVTLSYLTQATLTARREHGKYNIVTKTGYRESRRRCCCWFLLSWLVGFIFQRRWLRPEDQGIG